MAVLFYIAVYYCENSERTWLIMYREMEGTKCEQKFGGETSQKRLFRRMKRKLGESVLIPKKISWKCGRFRELFEIIVYGRNLF
jgi:hypothetical protein